MNDKKYNLITFIALSIVGIWFLSGMVLLGELEYASDAWKGSLSFKVLLYTFIGSSVPFLALLYLGFKTKGGKRYFDEYDLRKSNRIKHEFAKYESMVKRSDFTDYTGKNEFPVLRNGPRVFITFIFITFITSLFIVIVGDEPIYSFIELLGVDYRIAFYITYIVIVVIVGIVVNILILKYFSRKVLINVDGVTLKTYKKGNVFKRKKVLFPWDKIKSIGVTVSFEGFNTRIFDYIYFSKKEVKTCRFINEYHENRNRIILKYRPEVIHCIYQYWDGDIFNSNTKGKLYKYLKKIERKRFE